MIKTNIVLGLALLVIILFSGCSKDRKLFKGDGEWNIDQISYDALIMQGIDSTNISQNIDTNGVITNAGHFSFKKDGKGSYEYTINGVTFNGSLRWVLNDTDISITSVGLNFSLINFNINQEVFTFSGELIDNNNIEISGTHSSQGFEVNDNVSIEQYSLAGTFFLSK